MPARPGRSGASPGAGRLLKAALVILMTALLAGVGIGFGKPLVDLGQDIRYGLASRDWPGTVGVVEHAYVESKGERRRAHFLRIRYRYELGGRTLHSERIGTTSAYKGMHDVVAAYPAGAEVLVYHEPGGTVSVLERGIGVLELLQFVFMLLCALVMAVLYAALLHLAVTTPAGELLAQVRDGPRTRRPRWRDPLRERERQGLADRAMAAEIAERLREQRARRGPDQA